MERSPWFYETCREKRDAFHAAIDRYTSNKSRAVQDLLNI